MSYPAISLATATVSRHRRPQKRLQTARQPPVYPNSSPDHRACNSLTPLPLSSRRPSLSIGGFGLNRLIQDLSEDQVLEAVEEAQEGRLIEELPQRAGQYKFAHMLTQETLSEELSLTRRVRLHAQIGETLEELYGAGGEVHAAELAYHFVQAETATGAEKLVKYTLLAGEQALAASAYDRAFSFSCLVGKAHHVESFAEMGIVAA